MHRVTDKALFYLKHSADCEGNREMALAAQLAMSGEGAPNLRLLVDAIVQAIIDARNDELGAE